VSSNLRPTCLYVLILICCIIQAGCAVKLPQSTPIKGSERAYILDRYISLQKKDCAQSIDADVSFELKTFGKHQKATGFLQIQPPSLLRITIVDQVGRPLFILVSTGKTFTLVDSMQGQGIIGSVESISKQEGEPLYLQADEVISLLQGRLTPAESYLQDVRQDKRTSELVWLIFSPHEENRHNVLFNPEAGRIERYVVDNKSGDIILDIDYSWNDLIGDKCPMLQEIKVTGAFFQGEITLKYDLILPEAVVPENVFELTLPEHYTIKRIE